MRGKHAGKLKEDAEKLIDKLLHDELEIEGYKKDSKVSSFHDKTLSIYNDM